MAQRGSDKHGPLLDDALEREVASLEKGAPTSSRAEEFRDPEAPADDDSTLDARPDVDIEKRADIARYLDRVRFPAKKESLIENAVERHAPDVVVETLSGLPDGQMFENVQQIWEALGGQSERRE